MNECVFCKIIKGEIPTKILKETPLLVVFEDIHPKASPHLLIVPKKHVENILTVDNSTWLEVASVVRELANETKLKGFRLVHNAGNAAMVHHLHVHFLGEVQPEENLV